MRVQKIEYLWDWVKKSPSKSDISFCHVTTCSINCEQVWTSYPPSIYHAEIDTWWRELEISRKFDKNLTILTWQFFCKFFDVSTACETCLIFTCKREILNFLFQMNSKFFSNAAEGWNSKLSIMLMIIPFRFKFGFFFRFFQLP